MVLKPFHVKDPQNYIYLAADPHLKICCSRDPPPEAEIELQKFALKNVYWKDFLKIADLQARSAALGAAL